MTQHHIEAKSLIFKKDKHLQETIKALRNVQFDFALQIFLRCDGRYV